MTDTNLHNEVSRTSVNYFPSEKALLRPDESPSNLNLPR
jgi:hypothetical protein